MRGEISIIGFVRAPVAIINFAFFVRGLLIESYIKLRDFAVILREKFIIATGARITTIIEIPLPPHKKNPFGNPPERWFGTKKAWEWQCSSERLREQFQTI